MWINEPQVTALRKAALLVVQDLLPTPLSAAADYVLPSAAWSEKEGTYINQAGLAQAIGRACHAPGESRTDNLFGLAVAITWCEIEQRDAGSDRGMHSRNAFLEGRLAP